MKTILEKNPVPAYFQIEKDLRERISRQEWDSNSILPSEAELASSYKVSRVTVRQALKLLEDDGIIIKKRGKGSYLTGKQPKQKILNLDYGSIHLHKLDSALNISSEVFDRKNHEKIPVFFLEVVPSIKDLSFHYIERIIYLDDRPIALNKSWINQSLAYDIESVDLFDNSISKTLRDTYNIKTERLVDYIHSVKPTIIESEQLKVASDANLLSISGISYIAEDKIIELSTTIWDGDQIGFKFQIEYQI